MFYYLFLMFDNFIANLSMTLMFSMFDGSNWHSKQTSCPNAAQGAIFQMVLGGICSLTRWFWWWICRGTYRHSINLNSAASYLYMVPCPVFPPPHGMGPQVAPPSLVFASYWQHFWGPASYLLGTCYLLDNLRSTHTPSKYLRATYSNIYMCFVSTSFSLHIYIYIYLVQRSNPPDSTTPPPHHWGGTVIYIQIYIHTQADIHTNMSYTHAHRHTYIHACMHPYIHTYIHTYIHACIQASIHTIQACIHACIHTCIHTYIHAYIHTYIHTHTHIHTYTHTITNIPNTPPPGHSGGGEEP